MEKISVLIMGIWIAKLSQASWCLKVIFPQRLSFIGGHLPCNQGWLHSTTIRFFPKFIQQNFPWRLWEGLRVDIKVRPIISILGFDIVKAESSKIWFESIKDESIKRNFYMFSKLISWHSYVSNFFRKKLFVSISDHSRKLK